MRASFLLSCVAALVGAAGRCEAQTAPHRDAGVEALIQEAHQVPPEFEADAIIRIAQSPKIDADWRRELLDYAFNRAYGAQESYRRMSYGVPPESRQGVEALEYDSRLTRVSLQTRATQMMAVVNPLRARDLFEWIQPGVEATPCEQTLVPALGEYYTTLSMIARTTFPQSQRADAMWFLELYLWRAHLPSEMPAVASAVMRFAPRVDEAMYLEGVLHQILETGLRDPRGLSVVAGDIITRFGDLEDADFALGLRGWYLLRAVRDYMKAQLSGPRCSDGVLETFAAESFNARVRRTRADEAGVRALELADVRSSRLLPGARIDLFWQTLACARRSSA